MYGCLEFSSLVLSIFSGPQADQPIRRNLFPSSGDLDSDSGVSLIESSLPSSPEREPQTYDGSALTIDSLPIGVEVEGLVTPSPSSVISGDLLSSQTGEDAGDTEAAFQFDEDTIETETDSQNEEDAEETEKRRRNYTPPEKLTRKRKSQPTRWKINVAKTKLNEGEEHLSVDGKLRRGRTLQPGCTMSCRSKCSTKITEEERYGIFKQFWKIPNQTSKWEFIARHLKLREVASPPQPGTAAQRKSSRQYFFRVRGADLKVCKTQFLNTLDICDGWVETAVRKLGEGGAISPDKRGSNPRPLPDSYYDTLDSVRNHIKVIPRMPSHYSRADSTKEYLLEDLCSVSDMHEIYLEWMAETHPDITPAKLRQYRDIFNTEFNISFFISKKDLCDECASWDNCPEEQRPALQASYRKHIADKDCAQALSQADKVLARMKTSTSLVVAHFDYEKSLNCPKANTSIFYYRRKLTVSNFTIVDVGRNEDSCYVYDESVARKGSNEVASCLHHFIERKCAAGCTEFHFYCDNCGGQNKNRNVATLFAYAAVKFNIKIVLTYLEKGHTYNLADTVHSLIERKTRPLTLYTPDQWYEKMAVAKKSKKHPINLVRVDQTMIFNWLDLQVKLNLDKDANGRSIPWTKLRQIVTVGSSPHELQYKVNFEDELTPVITKSVGRPVNFRTYGLQLAYNGPLPIAKKKLQDLLYYCDHNYIPQEYHHFYRSLQPSANDEADEEECDAPVVGRPRKRKPSQAKAKSKRPRPSTD